MSKINETVDQAIELTLIGELTVAKELMLAYAGDDEWAFAFITGLVFGKLHQVDKEVAHSFMRLFKDEMKKWYPSIVE